jgi:prolyl-tRNA synthetase
MSKQKDFVKEITAMEVDFPQWYTDVVLKAELVDYASVRGCMIIRPYGYALWENIRDELDRKIKETGHENVYMPMFIPESSLQKEKDHIDGFAPEVAWVTHGGNEKLEERLCVRPTSEVLFCEHYAKIIRSHRDLPKLYNQWANVVRWEKTTRPFLRTLEFLWQEGHTAHATAEEAQVETLKMLDVYAEIAENLLAIPVVKGQKTEKEKFAGAHATYSIESLMHDGKALQSATSHNFGDGFAQVFGIQYTDKEGKEQHVHQTSWGFTTRIIGALIMVHGDNRGLVLPPRVAPKQVMIVPIAQHKEGVLDFAYNLKDQLNKIARVDIDATDKMPGWKFNECEMKGYPIRLEVGPKDIENGQVVLVRRDTLEKTIVKISDIEKAITDMLEDIQQNMFNRAKAHLNDNFKTVTTWDDFTAKVKEGGFIKAMWCGDQSCEEKIKEETTATSRNIPFEQEYVSETCICCCKKADKMVAWARAY